MAWAVAESPREPERRGRPAVDSAARAVEIVANAVAEALSDVVETGGTLVRDGLWAAGDRLGGGFVVRWAASLVSAVFDLAATLVKVPVESAGGLVAGAVRVVFGVLWAGRGGGAVISRGVGDLFSGLAGAILLVGGKTGAVLLAACALQRGERRLTPAETALLRQVYGDSVALFNVRVMDFTGPDGRAFVLGNTIYLGASPGRGVLVHECCHVWQYQHRGARYAADALLAQYTLPGQGYRWREEPGRGRRAWRDFNPEAQAQFLQDLWLSGLFQPDAFDGVPLAAEAVRDLRARRAVRFSALLERGLQR